MELKLHTCAIAARVRVSASSRATAVSTKILSVRVEFVKPNLSEPGFTGLSDFQDYSHLRISGKAIRIPQRTYSQQAVQQNLIGQSAVDLRKLTSFAPDNLPNLA